MLIEVPPRWLATLLFVAAVVFGMWALDEFAHWQFTAHLRDQAARSLALAATGETPYHWRFLSREDLIAGRVFEASRYRFDHDGLRVQTPDHLFEVGLPLARTIDLRLFPDLHVELDTDRPGQLQIALRESLDGPQMLGSPVSLRTGSNSVVIPLASVSRAAMIRLQFSVPEGSVLQLHSAALTRSQHAVRLDLAKPLRIVEPENVGSSVRDATIVYQLPLRTQIQKDAIAALVSRTDSISSPLVVLPQHGRVEQQIVFRNAIYSALPGAILIPANAIEASFAQARGIAAGFVDQTSHAHLRWNLVALFALVLAYFRFWPPDHARVRALIEIVLTLAGPAWLILGSNFDGGLHHSELAVIALTIIYSASLSVRRLWRWNGGTRAWLLAAGIVAIAIACGLLLHDSTAQSSAPGTKQILRYFGWALLQQYLICAVCTERWRLVTGGTLPAIYLGALCFALLHSPNATLMLATFTGGLFWCALYLRDRALLPLAVSHALSALALLMLLPRDVLHSAEVSARFFL